MAIADELGGVLLIRGVFYTRFYVRIMVVGRGWKRWRDAVEDGGLGLVAASINRPIIDLLLPPNIALALPLPTMNYPCSLMCQTRHPQIHGHFIKLLKMISINHQ